MSKPLHAIYHNGQVDFKEETSIPEGAHLKVIVVDDPNENVEPYSFFDVAESMDLKGPEDWSENHRAYANGEKKFD